jgi:hypothetical protein
VTAASGTSFTRTAIFMSSPSGKQTFGAYPES